MVVDADCGLSVTPRIWIGVAIGMKRIPALFVVAVFAFAMGAAKARDGASPEAAITYDIPAQSLESALNAYVLISGVQVLYETAVTEHRHSRELRGKFAPELALARLLDGTGLVGRRTAPHVFVVTKSPSEPTASAVQPDGRFLAALQTNLMMALCRAPETRPGGYKVGIDVWVHPDGVIARTALIGSTGEIARDQAMLRVLKGVAIGVPPPSGLRQPLFLTVSGRAPRESGDCAISGARDDDL